MAASCCASFSRFSPSWLPTPLPGCLLACLESLFPVPLPCCSCAFCDCSPAWPSWASACWFPPCCWPFFADCCFAPFCCPLPCWPFCSPACCCPPFCCCGFIRESRFWTASFTLLIRLLFSPELLLSCFELPSFESCLLPCCPAEALSPSLPARSSPDSSCCSPCESCAPSWDFLDPSAFFDSDLPGVGSVASSACSDPLSCGSPARCSLSSAEAISESGATSGRGTFAI